MKNVSSFNQNGFKRGAWSQEEDEKLRAYITRYGHWNWGLLPKFAGLSRSGKSCRLRWMNYLRPDMKHGNFTIEEDNIIVDLHNKLGNKWSAIAAKLPGRSDNEIKNRWNVHLKKRAQVDQSVQQSETLRTMKSNQVNSNANLDQELQREGESSSARVLSDQSPSCSSCSELTSHWLSGSDCAASNDFSLQTFDNGYVDDFWTEPFFPDITSSVDSMSPPLDMVDDFISGYCCQDTMMMNDEFTWSMLDSQFEYNSEFMN